MTDYLDIFEFSSKAAYALYLKNGNEEGTTCSGYFNSSLAQGRVERDNSLFQDFFGGGGLDILKCCCVSLGEAIF